MEAAVQGREGVTQGASQARAEMRKRAFLSDDGVVLASTLRGFDELGLLEPMLAGAAPLPEALPDPTASGIAYLRAGIRTLACQGWVEDDAFRDLGRVIRWTDEGTAVAPAHRHYIDVGRFLAGFTANDGSDWRGGEWPRAETDAYMRLVEDAEQGWPLLAPVPDELAATSRAHLEGGLIVPTMLLLLKRNGLGGDVPGVPEGEFGGGIERFLRAIDWIGPDGRWTARGLQGCGYAIHFGIVGSYLPMLARLPDLYRGELVVGASSQEVGPEWHVDRELNVLASSAAHGRYFADANEIFLELFNREPVSEQPRFIADIGCGDGSWLIHLYELIRSSTRRGEMLDEEPLVMVGLDYNEAALDTCRATVAAAGVPALALFGDVSDPAGIRDTLAEHGLAIEDGLHIRAFLDHDRTFIGGGDESELPGSSSGAYVAPEGRPLSSAEVEADLAEHLARWTPFLEKHGLITLEAHCVAPRISREHLGALHSVAFDSYHAYSHQYPIEYSAFINAARVAGLERLSHTELHYPSSRPFVAVSLNRFLPSSGTLPAQGQREPDEREWSPGPGVDIEDGEGLHRLLFSGGDIRHPRPWCSAATGHVVRGTIDAIESRLARGRRGDRIGVLDYGTGTGLAAIELLKAMHERGLEQRLDRVGVEFELHLADLPSGWFARAHELLSDCRWARFHSLRANDGSFRPLADALGRERIEAVMSNMVFHLVPPSALPAVTDGLADVIAPGGRLLWNSPDLGPAHDYAVLFHDANRELRRRWLELLRPDEPLDSLAPSVREIVEAARARLDPEAMRRAQERADRRVLPQANAAVDVEAALRARFKGDAVHRTYEILNEETVDALLVRSNQEEFLSEVEDRGERELLIRSLMLDDVLPRLQAGPAGTALGLNIQWTLGNFELLPDGA